MKWRYCLCAIIFLASLAGRLPAAHADSWLPPKPSVTYESATGDACFTVTASGRTGSLVGCRGTLLVKSNGSQWHQLWDKPLQNPLSPVTAVVADGGWRVITFDNYYSAGCGDEVIVFYSETGDLIRKYSDVVQSSADKRSIKSISFNLADGGVLSP